MPNDWGLTVRRDSLSAFAASNLVHETLPVKSGRDAPLA